MTEGERRALGESFDLIVLDLMLPGRGGLEILRALRQPECLFRDRVTRGARSRIVWLGSTAERSTILVKPFRRWLS